VLRLIKKMVLLFLLATTIMMAGSVYAATYVCFRGSFYIQYPDDWLQVPYLTADMFLSRTATDQSALNYEAVFAPKTSSPFFATDYLILTLDSMEWLYDYQIDSVVEEMNKSFGENIEFFRIEELPSDFRSNQPVYDKNKKVISVVNDILSGDKVVRKNLTVKKFYDKGVANFYFYSPDSLFERSRSVFDGIVSSFSTENIQQAIPKEEGKVGDGKSDSLDKRKMLIPGGVGFIILVILLIRLRKAAKAKKQMENS